MTLLPLLPLLFVVLVAAGLAVYTLCMRHPRAHYTKPGPKTVTLPATTNAGQCLTALPGGGYVWGECPPSLLGKVVAINRDRPGWGLVGFAMTSDDDSNPHGWCKFDNFPVEGNAVSMSEHQTGHCHDTGQIAGW